MHKTGHWLYNLSSLNILFVCSRNKRRSLTAETIFRNYGIHTFTSAGTEESARRRLNEGMVKHADIIFLMEQKHKTRLLQSFNDAATGKQLVVLDIPDEYEYIDKELANMLRDMVIPYL